MPWMPYENWSGNVIGARIRVPVSNNKHEGAFGASLIALDLMPGATGTIRNILAEGASFPSYVRFTGSMDLDFALEVRFRRSENSEAMWRAFRTRLMEDDEAMAVIPRAVLARLEIEYPADG